MRITTNPDAQVLGEFGYARPDTYDLRVVSCDQKMKEGGEWPYLQWVFEFADPNIECANNEPGQPKKKAGNIFEITTLKPDAQGGLRTTCEGLGLKWGDFDTDEVRGIEFRAKVGTDIYNNKTKNVIDKYLKR